MILISFLCVLCVSKAIFNDGYCDNADGSDENTTSACSGVNKALLFSCVGDYQKEIPFSRVHDGICDCCDGSDEVGSPWGIDCGNTCLNSLAEIRASIQAQYQTVKLGLQKKREYENLVIQNTRAQARSYEKYAEDKGKIKALLARIQSELPREETKERVLRFHLLRGRQHQCALGIEESCDYFHPEFFSDSELLEEGVPAVYENDKKRLIIPRETIDQELNYLSILTGYDRVYKSICPHSVMLPEDSVKVFRTVGEYVDFMNSTTGRMSVTPNPTQMRRNTLLGPYLEFGDQGFILAAIHMTELAGFFVSVLALPSRTARYFASAAFTFTQTQCSAYLQAHSYVSASSNNTISERIFLAVNATLETVHSLLSSPAVALLTNPYRYSLVVDLMDRLHPLTQTIHWVATICFGAPQFYYDVWFKQKLQSLPQKRQACLLREGLLAARRELAVIDEGLRSIDQQLKGATATKANDLQLWELVRGKCLTKEMAPYTYQFCFFGRVSQDHTTIGEYKDPAAIKTTAALKKTKSSSTETLSWDTWMLKVIADWFQINTDRSEKKVTKVADTSGKTTQMYTGGQACFVNGNSKER